jgi:predicted dehydrogenase
MESLEAKKAVFVEKPMAITEEELLKLKETIEKTELPLMVGFNRRFAPHIKTIKKMVDERVSPLIINYRMNAGFIPREHWVHTEEGGGRNIGEACHIYDLFDFLTDSEIHSVNACSISPNSEQYLSNDNFEATIKYKNGSICNLIYTAIGAPAFPKEQMDIYYDGKTIQLNDFREVYLYDGGVKLIDKTAQDKGHFSELKILGDYLLGNDQAKIIPLWQLVQATQISFEVEKQIRES